MSDERRMDKRPTRWIRDGEPDKKARKPPLARVAQHPEQQPRETKPAEPDEGRAAKPPVAPVPQTPDDPPPAPPDSSDK